MKKYCIINTENKKITKVFEKYAKSTINKNFAFSDVFRGTSKCANLDELSQIMYQNIEDEFADFDKNEIYAIMYFVCRIEHEKHPENAAIEALRTNYLKGKVM